jgi:hypothetical protein
MLDTLLLRPSLHFTQLHFTSLHLSTLHFLSFKLHPTTLHYTCRHFTSSHLNFTQPHFTALSFGLTPFKFPTAPFHLTSLVLINHTLILYPNQCTLLCPFVMIEIKTIEIRSELDSCVVLLYFGVPDKAAI